MSCPAKSVKEAAGEDVLDPLSCKAFMLFLLAERPWMKAQWKKIAAADRRARKP